MASKLIILLSGVLGVFFLYAGVCKLYPMLDQDLHLSMKKHFVNYARVAPLRTNLNMKFKASQYRSAVGSLEIVGGFGLLSMTGRTARLIGFVMLIAAELFMIHSYQALGDPLQKYIRLVAAAVLLTAQMMFERWFAGGNGEEEKAPSIPAKNREEEKAPSMPVKKEKKSRKSKGAVTEESKKES
ncbi:transmembrane protein 35A [Strongylocentrotus purpuratus]|uniref:Novel acetylcholine receptor chaperone n=1 Tax=Strongylocentrotus purpuratus TaxID=7668 RepID=A0A7M7RFE7_STRPU|nr:transmembrane protein 35A [Strongylocentrotus purpuratus]|eukprot:XP_788478.2 PREDICTED: transmembrane protein 35-like [Strongylocentrotus purpuratus]